MRHDYATAFGVILFSLCFIPLVHAAIGSAGAGGTVAPTSAENDFVRMLVNYDEHLSDENKKLLQEFISGKLHHGVVRSQAGVNGVAQMQRVLAWDAKVSFISFLVAHGAVLIGFFGALAEFVHAFILRRKGKTIEDTEITLKLESVAVKTTSMGVILLICSVAFYFLYLKFVYPIQVVPI